LPLDLTKPVPPASGMPAVWLIGQFAISVGPPLFAVSATAPLLQRWFSQTDHPAAADPYFLYTSSNAGSLSALLAYPLLVEQHLPLPEQSQSWTAGFALMAIAVAACWVGSLFLPRAEPRANRVAAGPSLGDRLGWIAYAALPSALLLAVTAHITTDLASTPLFWVVPLALCLLTFIFAFARRPLVSDRAMLKVQPFLIIPLVVISAALHSIWVLGLHLALFFVTAMICHDELSRRRPPAENLTEFYLYVSLGECWAASSPGWSRRQFSPTSGNIHCCLYYPASLDRHPSVRASRCAGLISLFPSCWQPDWPRWFLPVICRPGCLSGR
jgi:hypothetical protein